MEPDSSPRAPLFLFSSGKKSVDQQSHAPHCYFLFLRTRVCVCALESTGTCDHCTTHSYYFFFLPLKIHVRHPVSFQRSAQKPPTCSSAGSPLPPPATPAGVASHCRTACSAKLDAMVSSSLIMWGYSNTETLGGCETQSAFSAFLPGLINGENTGACKATPPPPSHLSGAWGGVMGV